MRLVTPATLPRRGRRARAARAARGRARHRAARPSRRSSPCAGRPQPAQRRLSYSAAAGLRALRVPLLPRARARHAARDAAAARAGARSAGATEAQLEAAAARLARPRAARATGLRAARARPTPRRSRRSRGQLGARAHRDAGRRRRRRRSRRSRASPLCARLARGPAASGARPAFAFALEPRRRRPARHRLRRRRWRARPTAAALIVDYKTDRLGEEEPAALVERDYATQRMVYALAALRDGAPRVEVAYCLLERPGEPVTATFTQADAPGAGRRAAAARRRRARGALAGGRRAAPRALRRLPRAARRCARGPRR